MIRRALLTALLALPLPALAQTGPSFDCARARAWDERNICAFGDLAALDRQIAAAWRAVNERAPEQDRARLQAEQRAWLGERRACQGPVEREAVSCLRRTMRARARDLEAMAQAAPGGGSSASSSAVPTAKPAAAPTPPQTVLRAADCASPAGWAAQRICTVQGMRELDAAVVQEAQTARARFAAQPAVLAEIEAALARYVTQREACARALGRIPVDCLQETMEDMRTALRRRLAVASATTRGG
ncbi:DUF1311 domain-containing protein [Roseomonas eburnea]|uniref:DUF1311 domain-containing protein n=1 Tax=Neoroseomonas eburnea TaxID=1346889 RepID=A0A9X9XB92_9PROT|nr:lysozyme inhibitor LprI family protein [Neoroseomonas eburnea]MBR0680978.1 DUF1311 domain-containing protein [Neoroseomonas eburnea]